jgi:hypothetical protein
MVSDGAYVMQYSGTSELDVLTFLQDFLIVTVVPTAIRWRKQVI